MTACMDQGCLWTPFADGSGMKCIRECGNHISARPSGVEPVIDAMAKVVAERLALPDFVEMANDPEFVAAVIATLDIPFPPVGECSRTGGRHWWAETDSGYQCRRCDEPWTAKED